MDDDGPPGVGGGAGNGVGARYAVDVGPGSQGVRVVVRHRVAEGGLTDVLGVLLSWADGELVVERRDGTRARLAEGDVVAAKRVPPPPERRR